MNTAPKHEHVWTFVRMESRYHRTTGEPLAQAIRERCEVCARSRLVNADTGRTIR